MNNKREKIRYKLTLGEIIRGIAVGILITNIISLIMSYIYGNGEYMHTAPELVKIIKSENLAVLYQFLVSAILGIYFEYIAVVWKYDKSFAAKMAYSYILGVPAAMFVAYIMYWAKHDLKSFFVYLSIYSIIYVIIQTSIYMYIKGRKK